MAIRDVERYLTYMDQVAPALEAAGADTSSAALTTYEGDWQPPRQPPRIVLMEFP